MQYLDLSGDIIHVHDPTVIKTKFGWRCFSTNGGMGIRVSDDLKRWKLVRPVFEKVPAWAAERGARDEWAPEVIFLDGKWRIFYSVSRFGSQTSAIGLATCESEDPGDLKAEWRDEGPVFKSERGDPYNAIDAAVHKSRDGSLRMTFGSFWTGIYQVRLDPKTLQADGAPQKLATAAGTAIEGPYLFERGGWHYLLVSHDFCCRGNNSTYKMALGRAKSPEGPFVDDKGKLLRDGGGTPLTWAFGRWRGPGHGMVVRDGRTDWLVHHAYDSQSNGVPTLRIARLEWKRDGWPGPQEDPKTEFADIVGSWEHRAGDGAAQMVDLLPSGKLNRTDSSDTWTREGDTITLRWMRPGAPEGGFVDKLTVAADKASYRGVNQAGLPIVGRRVA